MNGLTLAKNHSPSHSHMHTIQQEGTMITAAENTNGIASETTPTTTISTTASTEGVNDVNGASQTTTTGNAKEAMKEIIMKQLYEQSTQYKYWRFTQSALNDMRNKLNDEVI